MSIVTDIEAISVRISDKTVWTFVKTGDAEGRIGWGEATLQGEAPEVHAALARLKTAFIGAPCPSAPDVAERIGTCGHTLAQAAAASALDQALWDLAGQARGVSLAEALGGLRRREIPLYANINRGTLDRSPSGFAMRAREAVGLGFRAIKIAPFDGVDPAAVDSPAGRAALAVCLSRIAAVREEIGPDVKLMVDCHWRLTETAARDALRELVPLRLHWFECPLLETAENFPALRRLRQQANEVGVQLAGCETMIGRAGFRPFLEAEIYDAVMPDIKYAGGVRELLRIGDQCAAAGVACSPHNPTGPIAHAHSLHVSALLGSFPFLEFQQGESPLLFDLAAGLPSADGVSALPSGGGLGVSLDVAKLTLYRIAID